ncbi:hypothetical protein [Nostoc sp.]|uniref:hypothetical protein n=1 Tax=Nostoc sp. TaxID=1180 RepID=UPI002FFD0B74
MSSGKGGALNIDDGRISDFTGYACTGVKQSDTKAIAKASLSCLISCSPDYP